MQSQHPLDPHFSKFEGAVYQLPFDSLPKGYRPYVEFLVPAKYISWDEILVEESASKIPFPDVDYKELFGIIFNTEMTLEEDGKYEFILASDDGSKLWIKDRLVVNNDYPHKMRIRRDTISMRKGKYPVKIWYYQAYPTKYGVMFASNYIGPAAFELRDSIVWDSDILFEFDHYNLTDRGVALLDSFMTVIESRYVEEIHILGHTDNVGDLDYNYNLSQKRAQSIKDYINTANSAATISLFAIGYGEDKPVVPNDSVRNRARNRRVELVLR